MDRWEEVEGLDVGCYEKTCRKSVPCLRLTPKCRWDYGIVSELKLLGVTVLKNWDLSVTHVIASTDENGVCRRTLKGRSGRKMDIKHRVDQSLLERQRIC
ncbi:BRCA1-associated RING domain protein 1-like isoform X4 [Henckelia pumila]|uniref:BRCA1-associated RING domain protein 1-like isoform X4 n=1 Tax=Henckelia pumila TaxID=405737 RepID=UPI003C6E5F79